MYDQTKQSFLRLYKESLEGQQLACAQQVNDTGKLPCAFWNLIIGTPSLVKWEITTHREELRQLFSAARRLQLLLSTDTRVLVNLPESLKDSSSTFLGIPTSSLSNYILNEKQKLVRSNLQSKPGHKKSCLHKSFQTLVLHTPLEQNQPTQRAENKTLRL